MATKKYVLKNEKEMYADGTSNEEHIRDIIAQIEILYGNIQDNNDICLQLYKVRSGEGADEDTVDAIQIACENSIEIEKSASDIIAVIEKVKENLDKYDKSSEVDLASLLNQIKKFEKQSKKIMETIF